MNKLEINPKELKVGDQYKSFPDSEDDRFETINSIEHDAGIKGGQCNINGLYVYYDDIFKTKRPMKYKHIYQEIEAEIERSELKHGNQDHIPSLDQVLLKREGGCTPERMCENYEVPTENRAKFLTDTHMSRKDHTQAHIVVEELCEAISCLDDEEKMRKELIQLGAVVIKWIKSLDHQNNRVLGSS